MRPLTVRAAAQQVRAAAESASITSVFHEKLILQKMLHPKSADCDFPYVETFQELQRINSDHQSKKIEKKKVNISLRPTPSLPQPTSHATDLMQRPAITTKDIESFLRSHYLALRPPYEAPEQIDKGIEDLISASTANNLRTLMLFLSRYWQSGFEGSKPSIYSSRMHCRTILQKSLRCHPRTEHQNGGEQLGVPDMNKFEQFVANFFEYMGVSRSPHDELDDLLLQLCATCGSLNSATGIIMTQRKEALSESALQAYLDALASSKPTLESLKRVKSLLINDETGPAAVTFLLPLLNTQTEVLDLLVAVDRSALKTEVYEQCQQFIVRRLVQLGGSVLFPVLYRIKQHTQLNSEAVDEALRYALEANNLSAVQQLVGLAPKHTEMVEQGCMQINRST